MKAKLGTPEAVNESIRDYCLLHYYLQLSTKEPSMPEPTMRELYHVSLDTAEELRVELLAWLERQMAACATFASTSRLARDRNHHESQRTAYGDALHFWRNIRIDSKKGTAP